MINELIILLILVIYIGNCRNRVELTYETVLFHLNLIIENYKVCVIDQELTKMISTHNINKEVQFNSITKLRSEYDDISKIAVKEIINNHMTKSFRNHCFKYFTEDGLIFYITKKVRE